MTTAVQTDDMHAVHAFGHATTTKVWDLPTRIFHWSLAASFAGAWLTSESERLADLHLLLGYTFAGLLVFRLAWGVVGSRYARFSSFAFPPARVLGYLRSLASGSPEHHVGHNPAGAVAIFLMLGLGAAIAGSGLALQYEVGGEWLEEVHEVAACLMLAVVVVHIAGVVLSSLLHHENLARAMVTGRKRGTAADGIRSNRVLTGILLTACLSGFWTAWQTGMADAWLPTAVTSATASDDDHHDDDD